MMESTLLQPYAFMGAIYGGLVIGICYGIYDMIVRVFMYNAGKLALAVSDVLFYLIVLAVSAATLYFVSDGIVKLYLMLGILIGALTYIKTVHSLFVNLLFKHKI